MALVPLIERLNALVQEVRDMPRGGDLEGLIGTHLDGLRRECCALALEQRQQAAGQTASDTPGGTCKHLVKERFNVTGTRWKRANIPCVLALRLSIFNGQWADDWDRLRQAV